MATLPRYWSTARADGVIACAAVLTFASGLTVAARLYTRFFVVRAPGIEDAFVSAAWIGAVLFMILLVLMRQNGHGQHTIDLPGEMITNFYKWLWVCLWVYNLSLSFIKFSIVFQYKRLFTTPWFRVAVHVMLAVLTIYGLWTFFGCVFLCFPVSKFWDQNVDGKCINQWPVWYANAVLNILTDLMIILSPMPVLRQLQMPKRQKIALGGVFAVGAFVCVLSIIRLYLLAKANNSKDFTYDNITPAIWSLLEVNIAIMTASAPALKASVVRYFPRFGLSSRNGSKRATGGSNIFKLSSRIKGNTEKGRDEEVGSGASRVDSGRWKSRSATEDMAASQDTDEVRLVDGKIEVVTTFSTEVESRKSVGAANSRDYYQFPGASRSDVGDELRGGTRYPY